MSDDLFDPAAARPLLLVGPDAAVLELRGAEGVIGSGVGAEITTWNNRYVSQRHLRWRRVGEEAVVVEDLSSKNGTWVGGVRLGPKPTRLALGGRVNMAQEGDWVLSSTWNRAQTQRKLAGVPLLRFHEFSNAEVRAEVLVGHAQLIVLKGNRAKLLYLLAHKAAADRALNLAPESIGWVKRDALFREMWARTDYDYRLLGRVLNETRSRLAEEGLEDVIEARDAPGGRRARRAAGRIGSLRLRRDGAWVVQPP